MPLSSAAPFPALPPSAVTVSLTPHPAAPAASGAQDGVEVLLWRTPQGGLALIYHIRRSEPAQLVLPAAAAPAATDGLWQHSCCELFVARAGERGYHEFNFSPSGCWAVYAFAAERERCPDPPGKLAQSPVLSLQQQPDGFVLHAELPVALLPTDSHSATLALGPACVLEDKRHGLEYWALRHPRPQPDFHHRDGFCLSLPPALTT